MSAAAAAGGGVVLSLAYRGRAAQHEDVLVHYSPIKALMVAGRHLQGFEMEY